MSKRNILVVDDEPTQCRVLSTFIKNKMTHNCIIINNGTDAIDFFVNKRIIENVSYRDVDVILLDLSMPDVNGIDVLKQIVPIKGDVQVIVLTATSDTSVAIKAINLGAVDYIVKGDRDVYSRISTSVNNAIEKKNLRNQVSNLFRKSRDKVSFFDIIGKSPSIISAITLAKRAVNLAVPLLITGQSGVGKELMAMAIHGSSSRSGKPFVTIDCALLSYDNAEEELFGAYHISSSGVVLESMRNDGKIREAAGGTVFFKNIDSLPITLQQRLARLVADGEIVTPGTSNVVRIDVKVIASSKHDLSEMSDKKKFLKDLYYKLAVFPIHVPSLRERGKQDIELLSDSFSRDFSVSENKIIKGISKEVIELLSEYGFEDNIRELRNMIFKSVVLCDSDILKPEHFPQIINRKASNKIKAMSLLKKSSSLNTELVDLFDEEGRCKSFDQIEMEIIRRLISVYNGNMTEVSKNLQIGRSTIYRRLYSGSENPAMQLEEIVNDLEASDK